MDIVDIKSAPIKIFTDAYKKSLEADDTNNMFDIAYQWQDKPHRHVWDLCEKLDEAADDIERLRQQVADLVETSKATYSWISIWANHQGNCEGGTKCTCGKTAILFDVKSAIAKATGGE